VCPHHYERALRWFHDREVQLPAAEILKQENLRQAAMARARMAAEARSIVYYLRRRDGLIKIGTTTDYPVRLRNLRAEHGELKLLLAYAGTRAQETEAHKLFAADRAEGEWFRPSLTLLRFIQGQRRIARNRGNRLPRQVPATVIYSLIKEAKRLDEIKRMRIEREARAAARRRAKATQVAEPA
jgi:hypothetical protein